MNYKIHVSHAAEHDLHSAANYIAHQLQNPLAARRMLANALASIDSLETFPGRFPVIDEPLLASHQLHFVPVQNYLLFYRIDSSTQTVHILRFLYGHSDWQANPAGGCSSNMSILPGPLPGRIFVQSSSV